MNDRTIKDILNILKPYKKGCEVTSTKREASFIQKQGAKKLGSQIQKVIDDIEDQIE